ncbi:F-box/LRR-repeat protein [Cardamine amara subsp. amara]|uniref:F-box/LRR-repeat protein n=1 Tax=Cardamine amara subsp. amara TaxID=228776 RepID=A0ABD1AME8_CARAN
MFVILNHACHNDEIRCIRSRDEIYDLLNCSRPPPNIFVTGTLIMLKLDICDHHIISHEVDINLPSLKTLHLEDVQFEGDFTRLLKLLSCCLALEELIMKEMYWYDWEVCCVSSTTLKRLEV